jgi:hypothetical protein
MTYCRFLENLFGQGRALVAAPGPIAAEQLQAGDALLAQYEQVWRQNLPEPVPRFDPAAGRWAALWIYRACQFAVYRDVDADQFTRSLGGRCSGKVTAEVCYSVDLTFRFLPDLEKFVRSAAEADPLLDCLRTQARQWPLSSVGMSDIGDVSVDRFAGHPSLMQLYADRIITAVDTPRAADPRIRRQLESSVGMFPQLAPRFATEDAPRRVGNTR